MLLRAQTRVFFPQSNGRPAIYVDRCRLIQIVTGIHCCFEGPAGPGLKASSPAEVIRTANLPASAWITAPNKMPKPRADTFVYLAVLHIAPKAPQVASR